MAGETSAAGAKRNTPRATVHPDMPRSDSNPTEIGHRVDSQFLTPPPQVGPAKFFDYFQTEEEIEVALTILRERRRIRETQTPAPPTIIQATKRKFNDMLLERSDESLQPARETAQKGNSIFSRLGNDPVRKSGAPNYENIDSDSRSPSQINPKRPVIQNKDAGDTTRAIHQKPRISVHDRLGTPSASRLSTNTPSPSHSAALANMQRQMDEMKALLEDLEPSSYSKTGISHSGPSPCIGPFNLWSVLMDY
ncbi:hypothetical protein OROGR_018990 [Orobanche gracilis]